MEGDCKAEDDKDVGEEELGNGPEHLPHHENMASHSGENVSLCFQSLFGF